MPAGCSAETVSQAKEIGLASNLQPIRKCLAYLLYFSALEVMGKGIFHVENRTYSYLP